MSIYMPIITKECAQCNNEFTRKITPAMVLRGRGKFCSSKCSNESQRITMLRGEYRECEKCGVEFYSRRSEDRRGYKRRWCSKKCHGSELKERVMTTDGYWAITVNKNTTNSIKGKMKEHRYIYQKFLGRPLTSDDMIHHINHNKLDNRLENLTLMTRAEHNKEHGFLREGRPIVQYSLDGKQIAEYRSQKLASEDFGCSRTALNKAMRSNRQFKGFAWKYKSE